MSETEQVRAFKQITIERLPVAASQALSPNVLESTSLEWLADEFTHRLVMQLRAYILAERLGSHIEQASAQVPATWWDHWKQEHPRLVAWWSTWVWRMAPVSERTFTVKATWTDYATFPHATYIAPDQKRFGPVVFQRLSSQSAWWKDE